MAATFKKKLKTAPCQSACPAGVDVPRYIRYIRAGKFTEAVKVVRESIPFPAVCGYACIHPCEGECARRQYDESMSIRMLKRAAVDFSDVVLDNMPPVGRLSGQKVAIIGAGPAGLTAAYYLAGKGHQVTIFEKRARPGGLLRYGIPEYRLPNELVDQEIEVIKGRGVEIKVNSPIENPIELLTEGFTAVTVATGAWESVKIHLSISDGEGQTQDTNVYEGLQVREGLAFLEEANAGVQTLLRGRIVVVGGGNTAIDAARTAIRLGVKDVTLVYRRTRKEMPATAEEVTEALEEGVKVEFLAVPIKLGTGALVCVKMALGEPDASGRPQPQPVLGSEFQIPCDQVILAVGQAANATLLGLPAQPNGRVQTVTDSLAVETPGIFAAGDLVKGPSSVIEAIAQGRLVAETVDKMLGGDGVIIEKWLADEGEELAFENELPNFTSIGQLRPRSVHIPMSARTSTFSLTECGFDRETAMLEAARCLGCDINTYQVKVETAYCKDCGYCKEVCGLGVYEQSGSFNEQGYQSMVASATDNCVGCLKCSMICPDFAISVE
ncbi:MAG: hypothetical protein APF81_23080 [Desulfosporosinus sp. BRH_c37]|nr:MAG: hypothetical protein APF81_23080 [Desulfosporosinus sp. BRH_c37]